MNGNLYVALGISFVCLFVGLALLLIILFRVPKLFGTFNIISWLLIALVPVFPLFAIFPDSSFTLKFKTISGSGAVALFVFIWLQGMKFTREAYNVDQLKEKIKEQEEKLRKPVRADPKTFMYKLKNGKNVGLIAGDITNVKVADIWVSSENTNMEMARFFDRSVSAAIRYYGAKKDDGGRVIVERDKAGNITFDGDIIAEELKKKKGPDFYIDAASVFVTSSGQLAKTNNVKLIFHVAAVHGTPKEGYHPVPNLHECVKNVLNKAESLSYKSLLLPLLATGTAKGELEPISNLLITTAVAELESNAHRTLDTVYFLAWSDIDRDVCKQVFAGLGDRVTLC
jgi:O-acetyl-ADP-ribose deacetylase (regulator of RNase III)